MEKILPIRNGVIVEYCYNSGIVKGNRGVGGVIGQVSQYESQVQKCYNIGSIEGSSLIGGITGAMGRSSKLMNCWNAGSVKGRHAIGGLIGRTYRSTATIKNSYSLGKVEGEFDIGGILGDVEKFEQENTPIIENCYYLQGIVSESSNTMGEEKTQEQMKSQTFLDELNNGLEEPVWMISDKNGGYPTIKHFE